MTEVEYVIQNPPDLHKPFVRFSQPKSFTCNIFRIFDEYMNVYMHSDHMLRREIVYPIQHGHEYCK